MANTRSRLKKPADKSVVAYTVSLPYDKRLCKYDIAGSIAHANMLAKQGIITDQDAESITWGLASIREEMEKGKLSFKDEQEDIHMAIEARLIEKIGEIGGKLHTARSRNDQVALDLRLFIKEVISETVASVKKLQLALIDLADANKDVVIPGYTHLQSAQPVLLAHHLLAYYEMFVRDTSRFWDCHKRTDVMPLGSGALSGVGYKVDREFLARELGFSQVSQNSLDAVSDRDFILEFEAAASICMMHLSRLAEELVIWSSAEFGFIEIDGAFATSSSIMPQKKNPDVAELARGKTGRVYGNLMALLTTMKALPLAYNRDMQEDKQGLFDTVDVLSSTLEVFTGMVKTLKVKPKNVARSVQLGYILATDMADYLVKKGETFRSAHEIVAKLVNYAEEKGKTFEQLKASEFKQFSPLFNKDVSSITIKSSLASRDSTGGTAPGQVAKALSAARKALT
ncbi:MAG TPA: argininosuccinate lyase [Dehalococcoidia bacterium]|nr:argininosuccinate lyase [Dehalococcoidia bacterium]